MTTRTYCGRLALVVTALVFRTSVSAMVVLPAEFNEMVAASQTIVHGRVVDVRSYETAGRTTIESLVTVQVLDAIKGPAPLGAAEAGRYVYFRLPGGQVGRYRRIMVGAPRCERGDELVLFLKGNAPDLPMPFGLTQGVYRVSRDATGRATVRPVVNAGTDHVVRRDPSRRPLELATFTTLVRMIASSRP